MSNLCAPCSETLQILRGTWQEQLTPEKLENLHSRSQNLERSIDNHDVNMNSLVSANNEMSANISNLQARASVDKQVQL
jgi:hypothetical protein